jgi:DnaA family protein
MGEQLVFELAAPEPPSFDNFVAAGNAEAVAALRRAAAGELAETSVLLWGAGAAGKSHLLQAAVGPARAAGRSARYLATADHVDDAADDDALVAVDGVERSPPDAQQRLFSLFNRLAATRGHLITAAACPPAQLTLREDVRTRLGWGLVFEVVPLADRDKPAALAAFARERGFALPDDVIAYLLAHGRRDMASLVGAVAALDRYALSTKRPLTVPLLRTWLQQEMRFPAGPSSG